MSAVLSPQSVPPGDVQSRLAFQKSLQAVTNRIHATNNIDEIMLEVSSEICALFNADRLSIYATGEDKATIVSKVKTGLNSFRDLKLPIAEHSLAGFAAMSRKLLNFKDVYDDAELKSHSPNLRFLQEVDKRTGYRTKQMLVCPILDGSAGDLLGVVQLINNKAGTPFGPLAEEGMIELCKTLAIAFKQRQKLAVPKSKYDFLVADAVITAAELDNAGRTARKKSIDIETVLVEEMNVKVNSIGGALAKYFGVNYEPLKPDRVRPMDLLKNLKREYVQEHGWVPLEENPKGLLVMCLDPERTKGSRIVSNIFPKNNKITYCVTTQREFRDTLNLFFGADTDLGDIGDLLEGLGDDGEEGGPSPDDLNAAADNELVKLVNKVIVDAYHQGASDIHIESYPGKAKTEIRFRRDGSLVPYIEVPASYRNALCARLKIMCDLDISERRKPQDGKIKFKKFGPLDIELRVATIPTQGGVEDIVMRILAAGEPIPLDKLGLTPHNLPRLKEVIEKPYGLFFCCGPTGSGKTTTLHSVLGYLNTPDTKIWTAEDPIEITQKGLRQVQINKKAGLDFPTIMKAFLRCDPDIIMVGEMRDKETTSIGIERPHRSPGVRDRTPTAPRVDRPPARQGDGSVQLRRRAGGNPRTAPREAALRQMQAAVQPGARRGQDAPAGVLPGAAQHRRVQEGREGRVRARLQGPRQDLRRRQGAAHALQEGRLRAAELRLQGRSACRAAGRDRRDQEAYPGARAVRDARDRPREGGAP
jgi:hypothetical protein